VKAVVYIRLVKANGTIVTKEQSVESPWPYREGKAKFGERLEKAASSAVKAVMR